MVHCTVIGLGLLGCRITVELVSFGHHVHAYDKDQMQRGTLIERVEENVLQLENDGFIDRGIKFYDFITICTDIKQATENVDFIFEAASENINIKRAILKEATAVCSSETIIGTNTLTLPIESITEDSLFNERILGIRFLYPLYGIPFLEYTVSPTTSSLAVNKSIEFFASMGKKLMRKGEGARPMMLSASDADYYQSDFKQKRIAAVRNQHGQRFQQTSTSLTTSQPDNDKHAENSVQECKNTDDRNQPEDKTDECVVCNEHQINAIIFPCRHLWLCLQCASKLKSLSKPCPACRGDIEDVVAVFKP